MALIDSLRSKYPGYSDDELLEGLRATKYPDYSITEIADAIGYQPRTRGLMAVANDTVIQAANAAAGAVGAAADFVSPGNRVSGFIDENIIKPGEEAQSDAAQWSRRQFQEEVEAADGFGGELMAVGRKVLRDPLLTAAEAAGSFVVPGMAVKGAGALAGMAGAGARGVSRAGLAGGATAGAALAGGDAAGTAYDLVIEAGGTEAEATAAARQASKIPSVVGALGGVVGAERLLAGAGGMKGGLMARAFKTGLVEGAQEGFEEGITQFEGRRAAMPFDSTIDPWKGVGAAAGMGAVMGGGIGVAVGAMSDPAVASRRLAEADTVEDMIKAANDLAMAPLLPVGEATEFDPIPTGEAQELTMPEAAGQILLPPAPGQMLKPGRRIPRADVTEITPEEIELGIPTGEATELDVEQIQPGDLLTGEGFPYGTRAGAAVRATREGGGEVVQVPGGFVVRQESAGEPVTDLAGPAAVPAAPADGLGDQPGGSLGAVRPLPAAPEQAGGPAQAPVPGSGQDGAVGAGPGRAPETLTDLKAQWAAAAQRGDSAGAKAINERIVALKAATPTLRDRIAARKAPEAAPAQAPDAPAPDGVPAAPSAVPAAGSGEVEAGGVAPKRGEVGGKIGGGEVVITASGRQTTPFPKVSLGSNRAATGTVRAVDKWLLDNAAAEARARGDNFNAPTFEADARAKTIPQASKDAAEEYLFGRQPAVRAPILRQLVPATDAAAPADQPAPPQGRAPAAAPKPADPLTAAPVAESPSPRDRDSGDGGVATTRAGSEPQPAPVPRETPLAERVEAKKKPAEPETTQDGPLATAKVGDTIDVVHRDSNGAFRVAGTVLSVEDRGIWIKESDGRRLINRSDIGNWINAGAQETKPDNFATWTAYEGASPAYVTVIGERDGEVEIDDGYTTQWVPASQVERASKEPATGFESEKLNLTRIREISDRQGLDLDTDRMRSDGLAATGWSAKSVENAANAMVPPIVREMVGAATASAADLRERVTEVRYAPTDGATNDITFKFDGKPMTGSLRGRNADAVLRGKDAEGDRALAVRTMLDGDARPQTKPTLRSRIEAKRAAPGAPAAPEAALPAAASEPVPALPAEPKTKRPPKSFRKQVKVTTPVFVEEASSFEPREIDAEAAVKALDEDIAALDAFRACLKG